jgi:predicted Zn-dependent protease
MSWRWKQGTRVRVYYLKNSFNATETEAFSRAVANWNKALQEIDSSVRFRISGERESVIEDDASITVMRGVPSGKHRVGQLKFYSMSNGVMRALLIISPDVKDPDALTSLMIHEIGHSLGLADCYGCKRGTTAMAAFKDIKKGNEVYEPSECDKYVVAAGYSNATTEQARAVLSEQD